MHSLRKTFDREIHGNIIYIVHEIARIFSEIDRPPDFNANLSTNIVLNVVS